MYYLSLPKAINVEVVFEKKVKFPAVTVCNHNTFRWVYIPYLSLFLYYRLWGTIMGTISGIKCPRDERQNPSSA